MSITETISKANALLPGIPVADDKEEDPRWQAILKIEDYIEANPEEVWDFVSAWGGHPQEDLRDAIACVLLEHLLEVHFDLIFPRVETAVAKDMLFANMFCRCWKLGQSEWPANSAKFEALKEWCRGHTGQNAD